MAGRNFLFVPGPTNVPERVQRAMVVSMEDHRPTKFPELTKGVLEDLEWGEGVPVERYADVLSKDESHKIKAVLATHSETATGVSSDIAAVRNALDDAKHPALFGVSGDGARGHQRRACDRRGLPPLQPLAGAWALQGRGQVVSHWPSG